MNFQSKWVRMEWVGIFWTLICKCKSALNYAIWAWRSSLFSLKSDTRLLKCAYFNGICSFVTHQRALTGWTISEVDFFLHPCETLTVHFNEFEFSIFNRKHANIFEKRHSSSMDFFLSNLKHADAGQTV